MKSGTKGKRTTPENVGEKEAVKKKNPGHKMSHNSTSERSEVPAVWTAKFNPSENIVNVQWVENLSPRKKAINKGTDTV